MRRIAKIAFIVLAGLILIHLILRLIPYPELNSYLSRSYGFAVLDRNGRLLRVFPADDGVKREWAALKDIPTGVVRIFTRAEDKRFYLHPGIDPAAIAAAGIRNLQAGRTVSGASTITMQLARMIKPRRRGIAGKFHEAFDALRLEARLSKKQILELWINGIPFGSNIEGLPAASRARFGREPAQLDDARAVLLAVIPRRPSLYDPMRNPHATMNAALILSRQCRLNLNESDLIEAAADAAPEILTDAKNPFHAPHFTDRVNSARHQSVHTIGVRTTLDLDLQLYAERRLLSELAMLENNRISNGAILAIDNATGEVLIYVGSASWFDDESGGKIDGVRSRNQPGSCLKPFLYALALENGFFPNDILPDIPTVFGSSEAYSPGNFNRRFNGPVRFRLALASSLNVPAVYLIERLGVRNFEDWLAALGFDSIAANKGNYGVGLALGNAEVSLEEMTRAFAVFPRGGKMFNLRFTETQPESQAPQLMSPYCAWVITDILSDQASRFVGFGAAAAMATEFPSMFKTGTANQFQHIWALGASARFTVGVWMGNFSGQTVIGRTGSSIPARIASDLLAALESQAPETSSFIERRTLLPVPGRVREIPACSLSGMIAGPSCGGLVREWLPKDMPSQGGAAISLCTWHRTYSNGYARGFSNGYPVEYPPEYQAWLAERFRQGRAVQDGTARIRLPVSGSVFFVDPALPPEAQAIRIETAGFSPGALVYANDVLQGSLNHAGVFALPLRRGSQYIVVEDENGLSAVTIEVR
ncbi:MAG: penicillin-binding protein 1C [Treponema sp.]|nr:penicillin-binding protein 1C [Treponema sp.]